MHHLKTTILACTVLACPAVAQTLPTLTSTDGKLVLTIPYFEFTSGGGKTAYAVSLTSNNPSSFAIDFASLKATAVQSGISNIAALTVAGNSYALTLPYLEFAGGAYAVKLTSTDLKSFSPDLASIATLTPISTTLAAPTAVSAGNVSPQTLAGSTVSSSSKLTISWGAPSGYVVDHYVLSASESLKSTTITASAAATDSSATLSGLKSATSYSIVVIACQDSACNQSGRSAAVSAKTSEEYWQMQGSSGANSDAVSRVTTDSNTLNYALVYGDWADSTLKGRIRYYYNPNVASEKGMKAALSKALPSAATLSSITAFDINSGYGIVQGSGTTPGSGPIVIGQMQVVPYNSRMRVFFEAEGADHINRIYSLDSADGYAGLDFNPGSPLKCEVTAGDLASGGACTTTVALGVSNDGFSSKGVKAFRQMKLLYPTQTSGIWDGAANTPMVVTIDMDTATASKCAKYKFTQGWALWSGTKWSLQYASDGICPKLFDGVQAPAPVHLGGGRYKLYFSNNRTPSGQLATDFDNKPVKVIYGTAAGERIAFEDFENAEQARDINVLWPDGNLMPLFTSSASGGETKFDDYSVLLPTASEDFQVMYTNFSGGSKGAFTATAVLLNP